MNIPNLPTDNLYKFIALSGLAIYVFSIVYPIHLIEQYSELNHEIRTDIAKSEIESDRISQSLNALKDRLKDIKESYDLGEVEVSKFGEEDMKELKEKSKDPDYREYIKFWRENRDYLIPNLEELNEVERLNLEIDEKHYLHMLNNVDIVESNRRLEELDRRIDATNMISKVGHVLGGIMIIFGFTCWYTRVQRVLDLKLRAELLKASDELEKANKTGDDNSE